MHRSPFRPVPVFALALVLLPALPAALLARPAPDAAPRSAPAALAPQALDFERRFDANDLDLWTTNVGSLAFDQVASNAGLVFPRGSGKTAMFAAGLWVGAQVAGEKRVTVAEYSHEWMPGRILGGAPEDFAAPGLIHWKVVPLGAVATAQDTGFAAGADDPVRHHGWAAYVAEGGAVGAPVGTRRLPVFGNPTDSVDVPGPDLPGELALWSVFNDADPVAHTNGAGSTTPLGLEVRQTVFGFAPSLPGVAFVRWTLVNKGATTLDSTYVGFWSDPDIGAPGDDRVAWNAAHSLGYAYNAQDNDNVYGSHPPACGIQFLEGPPGVPLAAFNYAFSGIDPNNALESYRVLQGLNPQGNEHVDPTTGQPTRFVYPGDPLTGSGWQPSIAVDFRMTVSVGPFTLAPGDSATFTFALVAAQGLNRLESIRGLLCRATSARQAHQQAYLPPFPPLGPECEFVPPGAACPLPASTWAAYCADPSGLPPNALETLASLVFAETRSFAPVTPSPDTLCAALSVGETAAARARAEREHLALLANVKASLVGGIESPEGRPVGIPGSMAVSCPWSGPTTIAGLAERAPETEVFLVTYVRTDQEPRDWQPVDWGGRAYNGAVDFGYWFLASSLDPKAQRDSFPAVEIRYDPASTQQAYRYLRLQDETGAAPVGGREYRYGGYRPVPLEAIDLTTGDRLELAFVERALTDPSGTLLPSGQQPATFDSTWQPSVDDDGGREYLFVLRRGDSGTPRPGMEVDGVIADPVAPPPVLYAAWLRQFDVGDLPEPGEKLVLEPFVTTPSPGADARLLELAALPQDDPATIAGYEEIATCLAAINSGAGLDCTTTPVTLTLEESLVDGASVRLAWYVAGEDAGPFDLARRAGDEEEWTSLARLTVGGDRRVRYEDRAVAAGERWTYGLFDARDPGQPLDRVSVTIPGSPAFALRVAAGGGAAPPQVHFSLPSRGEARLELFDAAGRRHVSRPLGTREAGAHVEPLPADLARGLWFVRLTFQGRSVVAKAVALR